MNRLNNFFSPKSIAVVGASPKKGKLGNVLIENIKKGEWKGKLYMVNPKYAGKKASPKLVRLRRNYFASLNEIKKPVDLVLIAIPAPLVNEILENGANAKPAIKNFAVISSGFKESGKEGIRLEENLTHIADKYNLNILGPNCLGLANSEQKLNATFTDVKLQKGSIAIISQSGALAVALLDWATEKNIGFSKIISIGNKTDIEESEILNFLASDKDTKAIALYLEDIKNGSRLIKALVKITPRKPVIILKAGKTTAGQKAVSSHTGSLAQDQDIINAVFEKTNVIPTNNIEEFQDIIYYLNSNPVPVKNELIILTNAGGPGVMASDFIGKSRSIKLLDFPEKFKSEIKKFLPTSASVNNPIDVIGDAPPERYEKTLEFIAKYFPKNPVLVILTPQNQTDPKKVAEILVKFKGKLVNLSACFMGGEKIARAKAILEKNNILCFENPERVSDVIEKLVKYDQQLVIARNPSQGWINSTTKQPRTTPENARLFRFTRNDIAKALDEKRKMLFWNEAEKLFGKYGVKLAKSVSFENITDLKNKEISFPCALKTDDPNIAHRLEKNAVMLDIRNSNELKKSFEKMSAKGGSASGGKKYAGLPRQRAGAKHFLVQPMVAPGLELIIGMKKDPIFGPVILCGWGGSFTEVFKDKIILIPPFNQRETENKLAQLKIFPILKGFRSKRGYDLTRISKIISIIAQIALENPEIWEIDINPLMIYNDGKEEKILDVKIFL